MVEANTQLLGGAAVTVFLALLFFGVVVLWDVALALRSVGDKIDKLEDNIDDDLTDIAHHLDGMSNARGGGGGTQLHLSGGTISSGPGPNQPQQAPQAGPQQAPQAGPQQAPQAGHQQGQPTADPPDGVGPQPQSSSQQAERQSAAARRAEEPDEETASSERADPTESPGSDADDPQSDDRADGAADDERSADESATDADSDADDEPSGHPRAERSRGRFITSPDRTAWYATPLDREAIAAARPTIAGALTDGSDDGIDDSDVIAAGPVGSSTGAETHVAAGETVPRDTADGETDDAADGREASDAASETAERADSEPRESGEGEDGDAVDDEADGGLDTVAESSDPPDDLDSLSFDDLTEDADVPAEGAKPAAVDDESADAESADDEFADAESEIANPDDPDRSDVPDIVDDSTEPAPADEEPSLEDDAASDSGGAAVTESDADGAATADALSPFEFDEDEFEAEDVSVEDAVDTMNENAPAPELSSHRFDVTAEETGGGGAMVTLAFEPDTIEIEGSTKRLLQYQLQSFADRESTPAADVTIGRDRIVIEIADSEGTAIQRWGEAAVSIVDRTLYLSDNSPDS
ncbi:AAA family ATPase [Natrinema sp. CBA1119]|uniref:AAA family ATPase n=1 Tax=Natrinema sp. CBA1119 TaxID=1608465 RepID=UPI000BF383D4|nr:AAA family ATPase [Natrinema sp. CBA1119]PGF14719.1 AAA family ATPase [Natrinema sp. CBA1119]